MCKYLRFKALLWQIQRSCRRCHFDSRIPSDVLQMQLRKGRFLRGSCGLYAVPGIIILNALWNIRFHALSATSALTAAFLGAAFRSCNQRSDSDDDTGSDHRPSRVATCGGTPVHRLPLFMLFYKSFVKVIPHLLSLNTPVRMSWLMPSTEMVALGIPRPWASLTTPLIPRCTCNKHG